MCYYLSVHFQGQRVKTNGCTHTVCMSFTEVHAWRCVVWKLTCTSRSVMDSIQRHKVPREHPRLGYFQFYLGITLAFPWLLFHNCCCGIHSTWCSYSPWWTSLHDCRRVCIYRLKDTLLQSLHDIRVWMSSTSITENVLPCFIIILCQTPNVCEA